MGSWHSPWLFHTPVRAGSCCEMKSLLILLSHLLSFSHTHMHTNTHIVTNPYVLSAVSLSSHVLHGAFPYVQLHTGTPWADPTPALVCFWVVRPLWGLCLGPALAPTSEKMLVVRTGPGRGRSQRGGAGRYQKAQDLVASVQRSCLFVTWGPKALVLDSHNRTSLFSCLTWGIMQVTQFFPSDFGSSQVIKTLIFVFSLARCPLWWLRGLSDFWVSADITSNCCLSFMTPQGGSSGSVRLFHISGAKLMNHWSKPWRQVDLISSGMIFWELWKLSGFMQ